MSASEDFFLCDALITSGLRIALILRLDAMEYIYELKQIMHLFAIDSIYSNKSSQIQIVSQPAFLSVSDGGSKVVKAELGNVTIMLVGTNRCGEAQFTHILLDRSRPIAKATKVSKSDENPSNENSTSKIIFFWVIRIDVKSSTLNTTYYQLAVYKMHKNDTNDISYMLF